jgi:benzoyl-CoA reductase/2-hydroxyglutaryl-CoA dehydratase subunit BcrC/BadD/HgdB
MVVGGEIDSPDFIDVIEGQGALVVADSMGYGYRACVTDVIESGDPVENLAAYQVAERPACPRIFGTTFERNEAVKDIAKEYKVDGVISVRLPQCDEWAFEQVNLIKYLKKEGIPHMALDIDYVLNSVGQIKTRAQAFIETLV